MKSRTEQATPFMRMLAYFLCVIMVLGVLSSLDIPAFAASNPVVDEVIYQLNESKSTAVVYGLNDSSATSMYIAAKITVDGKDYTVTGISNGLLQRSADYTALREITVDSSNTSMYAKDGVLYNASTSAMLFCAPAITTFELSKDCEKANANLLMFCSELESITVEDGHTVFTADSGVLLTDGGQTLVAYPQNKTGNVYFPTGLTAVGNYAFMNNQKLTEIAIPNGITSVGHHAFQNCQALVTLTLSDSITTLGTSSGGEFPIINGGTFQGCTSLVTLNLGTGLENIYRETFKGCTSLTTVELPDSVKIIDEQAFMDCSSLEYIKIPETATLGTGAVDNCSDSLIIDNGNYVKDSYGVTYTSDYTTLVKAPTSLSGEYQIDSRTTTIAEGAFKNCTSLTKLTLPAGIKSVPSNAFTSCTALKEFKMDPSVDPDGFTDADGTRYYVEGGQLYYTALSTEAHGNDPVGTRYHQLSSYAAACGLETFTVPERLDWGNPNWMSNIIGTIVNSVGSGERLPNLKYNNREFTIGNYLNGVALDTNYMLKDSGIKLLNDSDVMGSVAMVMKYPDGSLHAAYCIDPEILALIDNGSYAATKLEAYPGQNLDNTQIDVIKFIAGYDQEAANSTSLNEEESIKNFVKQYMLWNVVIDKYSSDDFIEMVKRIDDAKPVAKDFAQELSDALTVYRNGGVPAIPSFASRDSQANSYLMVYDADSKQYTLELTDNRNVLDKWELVESTLPAGVTVTNVTNSKLTLQSSKPFDFAILSMKSKTSYVVDEAKLAISGGYQSVVAVDSERETIYFGISAHEPSEDGGTIPNPARVTIEAKKTLDGTAPSNNSFSFILKNENGQVVQIKNNNGGRITFDTLTFSSTGIFTYTISEVIGTDNSINYDVAVYSVIITVTKSGDYQADVVYLKDTQSYSGIPAFANTTKQTGEGTISIAVNKVWNGNDSADRPVSVTVQLYKDNVAYGDTVILNAGNGWRYVWNSLDSTSNWTVDEINVPTGYSKTVVSNGNEWTITNTKNTTPTPDNPDSPQTGDNSNLLLWIALLFVSSGAVAGLTVYGRKRKASR